MPTAPCGALLRIVEGVDVPAAQMVVDDENLRKWMEGEHPVPRQVFLRCVDIVNAEQLDQISLPKDSPPKDTA